MLAASISTGLSQLLGDLTLAGENCFTSRFSSQYLCGTERKSSAHVTLTARAAAPGKDSGNREISVLLDCGASSNFISPELARDLGCTLRRAYTTTYGLDGNILSDAFSSRRTAISLEHAEHAYEIDALVVPLTAYQLVLGMPWFRAQNPVIDWRNGKLLGQAGGRPPEASVDWISPGPFDTPSGRSKNCEHISMENSSTACSQSCHVKCLQHSAYPGARKFGVSLKVLPASDFAQLAERLSTAAATAGEGSRPWIHCIGLRQDLLGARSEGIYGRRSE
jgi:gag-polyprotein putative aspartyl protease